MLCAVVSLDGANKQFFVIIIIIIIIIIRIIAIIRSNSLATNGSMTYKQHYAVQSIVRELASIALWPGRLCAK